MSDTRWFEIDAPVAASVKHFAGAVLMYPKAPTAQTGDDRYIVEMAFMNAMQAGHTSLENALLRILELCGEDPPTGGNWHADLIRRASNPIGSRPAILNGKVAQAADATRRFRTVAAHAYVDFDHTQARHAVVSAALLADLLPADLARFRQAVDP